MIPAETAEKPREEPRLRSAGSWPWFAFAGIAAASAVVVMRSGRGLTFFYDEWDWILNRRANTASAFLQPHNGHLSLIPVGIFKVLFATAGMTTYVPYRLSAVLAHLACATLMFTYLRRRVPAMMALAASAVLLLLGFAWQDLLWPFQIGYFGSVGGGLGALLLLDRRDRSGDIGASLCIGFSLACSGVGLPVAGAVLVELVWRRETWRRLWVPVAPVLFYGIWYVVYGESQAKSSNLHLVGGYTLRSAAGAAGALGGLSLDNGRYLVGALVVLVAAKLLRDRGASPRFAAVLALPVAFWGLTALSRAQLNEPGASRYLYPGAVFLLLVLAELARDRAYAPFAIVLVVAAAAYAVHGNLDQLDAGASGLRDTSVHVRADLAALELAQGKVDPSFRPDPNRSPDLTAGPYFEAIDALGSPAESLAALRRQPEEVRSTADGVLLDALRVALGPPAVPRGPAPSPTAVNGGAVTREQSCAVLTPSSSTASMELVMPTARLEIDALVAPVDVRVRSFADAFPAAPRGTVTTGTGSRLVLPALRQVTWRVQLSSSGPLRVCSTT